jgi:hypothetical protein
MYFYVNQVFLLAKGNNIVHIEELKLQIKNETFEPFRDWKFYKKFPKQVKDPDPL